MTVDEDIFGKYYIKKLVTHTYEIEDILSYTHGCHIHIRQMFILLILLILIKYDVVRSENANLSKYTHIADFAK